MKTRYKTIVKKLCSSCLTSLNKDCVSCTFLKYNNVTNLLTFTTFLNEKHNTWIFFNVYEYEKGVMKTAKLQCFVKNKNEPVHKTI